MSSEKFKLVLNATWHLNRVPKQEWNHCGRSINSLPIKSETAFALFLISVSSLSGSSRVGFYAKCASIVCLNIIGDRLKWIKMGVKKHESYVKIQEFLEGLLSNFRDDRLDDVSPSPSIEPMRSLFKNFAPFWRASWFTSET